MTSDFERRRRSEASWREQHTRLGRPVRGHPMRSREQTLAMEKLMYSPYDGSWHTLDRDTKTKLDDAITQDYYDAKISQDTYNTAITRLWKIPRIDDDSL